MTTLLLTGATGFVGRHVLEAALASQQVQRVISLQRRPLQGSGEYSESSKLREVILASDDDWTNWPEHVKNQVADVDACIWCLGVVPSVGNKDLDLTRRVSLDYTSAGLDALLAARLDKPKAGPLRFIYISGAASERDQDASLYFWSEYRKLRGQAENVVLAAAERVGPEKLQVAIPRLGKVEAALDLRAFITRALGMGAIPVGVLVEQLMRIAIEGPRRQIYEMSDLQ